MHPRYLYALRARTRRTACGACLSRSRANKIWQGALSLLLVAQIDGYTEEDALKAIKRLEHIARWTTIAQFSNTTATQIKAGGMKMQAIFDGEVLSPLKETLKICWRLTMTR